MSTNLKTTRLNDGAAIPLVTDNTVWKNLTTPGYCFYSNTGANVDIYGLLYNWHTIATNKLCPTGWYVPSDAEWTILTNHLGGGKVAGGKMKETGISHWKSPNTGATNETGFSALPGGYRTYSPGLYYSINEGGFWWSSTQWDFSSSSAWSQGLRYNISDLLREYNSKRSGLSVRCLKD